MECCVDGPHNWHEKFLLGRYGGEIFPSNYLMGVLKDTIGLRVFDSGQFGSNSI
jgi:hypothetical protein